MVSLLTGYEGALYDQNGNLYFWLPVVAPMLGGVLGAALFRRADRAVPAHRGPVGRAAEPVRAEERGRRPGPRRPPTGSTAARQAPEAPLFVYGSLQFADVLRALLGRVPRARAGRGVRLAGGRAARRRVSRAGRRRNPLSKVSGVILLGLDRRPTGRCWTPSRTRSTTSPLLTLADGQRAWTYTCAESTSILDPDWSAGAVRRPLPARLRDPVRGVAAAVHAQHRPAAAAAADPAVLHDLPGGRVHRRRAATTGATPAPSGRPAPRARLGLRRRLARTRRPHPGRHGLSERGGERRRSAAPDVLDEPGGAAQAGEPGLRVGLAGPGRHNDRAPAAPLPDCWRAERRKHAVSNSIR